jgi:hypothetical protein
MYVLLNTHNFAKYFAMFEIIFNVIKMITRFEIDDFLGGKWRKKN